MKIRKSEIGFLLIVLLSFVVGFYFYPQMPESMASHWGVDGQVNGYMPKFWGVFLMPIISVIMLVFFVVLPRVDPKKENIEKFRNYFDGFVFLIFAFLFYVYAITLYWNLITPEARASFSIIKFLVPAFAILFYYIGILISHAKSNWSIGIRTPWTMSQEDVWDKTHKLGGTLFKAAAVISLLGFVFVKYAFWFLLAPVIFVTLFIVLYSYLLFRKHHK
ncbi:MAG: DUF1648 domain-containing protein [Candidatus Gracilibacteria bacterium]